MDFLGIGPLELIFILLIALIVFGPNDMAKAGRTLGRFLRRMTTSELWREVTRLRHLPNKLIREAGLEEDMKEINKGIDSIRRPPAVFNEISKEIDKAKSEFSDWTTDSSSDKAADSPSDKAADSSSDKTADSPPDNSADSPADTPAEASPVDTIEANTEEFSEWTSPPPPSSANPET